MTKNTGTTTNELDASLPQGTTETAPVVHTTNKFNELLKTLGNVPKPTKAGKTVIAPSSTARMRKICPEITDGIVDAKGQAWPGATMHIGKGLEIDGCHKGLMYVVRPFVTLTPSDQAYILKEFGEGNRDPIPARQKEIIRKQREGEWEYVGNTVVICVDEQGDIRLSEEHNAGHSGRGQLESGKTLTYTVIMGIPQSARDKIDDNAARSAKDIASTRSELKEFFATGTVIGGAVSLTEALSKKCKSSLTEALRIVVDVRHGMPPKSGGARDKVEVGEQLDLYGEPLSQAVGLCVALDSKSPTVGKEGKVKASGGFTKRVPLNHAVSMLTLAATVRDPATGLMSFDMDEAWNVMEFYTAIANEQFDDGTVPAVVFRETIDRWNATKKHDGTDGKNVRFAVLKQAYLKHIDEEEIRNPNIFEVIKGSDVTKPEFQIGGIDDYVDDTAKRLAEAANAPAVSDTPLPLINEDEMTETGSDVPKEIDE